MLYNTLTTDVYIIHENKEWIPPFAKAFGRAGVGFGEIYLTQGSIDIDSPPPEGVFWSRLSASSHTRAHSLSKDYGRAILAWLESHGRRVINGSSVLELEVSKVRQYLALNKAGFRTPKTRAVFGKEDLLECAKEMDTPFITKHNQGGKGLGVQRFENLEEFRAYIESSAFEPPIDGIMLLQEYIRTKEFFITRLEFIGGRFHYAVRVDTSDGAFELCPADACEIERAQALPKLAGGACDVGGADKFSLRTDIDSRTPIVQELERFLQAHKIEVAGVEFIESLEGEIVVYDINTNTNYNAKVESTLRAQGKQAAADRIVEFLCAQLDKIQRSKQ